MVRGRVAVFIGGCNRRGALGLGRGSGGLVGGRSDLVGVGVDGRWMGKGKRGEEEGWFMWSVAEHCLPPPKK